MASRTVYHDGAGFVAASAGMINVRLYGARGDGTTNDTTAIGSAYTAATAAGGVPLFFPEGTYLVTALPSLVDGDRIVGVGPLKSEILYAGTGTLCTLTGKQDIAFRSIGFHATGVGAVILVLSACFQIGIDDVRMRGDHTGSSGSTYRTQKGLVLSSNTGNTRVHNSVFANLGIGIETSCIQNEVTNSKVVNCYTGIKGVGGTANAGLVVIGCELIGDTDPDTVHAQVDITGTANTWVFESCWLEGSHYGMIVGVFGSGGPSSFTLVGCTIAARSVGLQINSCRQPSLIACEFNEDAGGTMTEIVFGGTPAGDEAIEGIAVNLVTTIRGDFDDGDFPQYWNVFRKGSFRAPNIHSSSNVTVDGGVDTGDFAMRNGSPAVGRALISDADGDGKWAGVGTALRWEHTTTTLATGVGQQVFAQLVPFDGTLVKVRYKVQTASSGTGTSAVELRRNGQAVGNTVAGSSAAVSTSPSWTTPNVNVTADDVLWSWITAVQSTPGSRLLVEAIIIPR